MRITRFLPALLAVLGAMVLPMSPQSAAAQTIPSPYTFVDTRHDVGIIGGVASENRGRFDLGPGGGPIVGVRYGFHLSGPFAIEGSGYFIDTDRRVRNPLGENGIEDRGSTRSLVGGMDGRLRFTLTGDRAWHNLAPFLQLGGGLAGDVLTRSDLEEDLPSDSRFNFGPSLVGILGAGTHWYPRDRIGVRIEVLTHIWKLGTPRNFFELQEELGSIPEQEWTGVNGIVLGGSFRF